MISGTVIVGTRKSLLAKRQTERVILDLKKIFSQLKFLTKEIETSGDRQKNFIPSDLKGVFVKEIEEALIAGKIDFAVHSLKDLPVDITPGLEIAAICKRCDPRDVLISRNGSKLDKLKKGSQIGTSSPRRKLQLLFYRPDLNVIDIRGNLDTRLRKLKERKYDAIIVAAAGLVRLGWQELITQYISFDIMLPAPGQGALGIQIRKKDKRMKDIIKKLNHETSSLEVSAERAFLKAMGGGCRMPIAALAKIKGSKIKLEGVAATGKNLTLIRSFLEQKKRLPEMLGRHLAEKITGIFYKQKGKKVDSYRTKI